MAKVRPESGLFLSAVNQSIGEWKELQHVIDVYGAGGSQAGEKLLWMADVICDFFKDNPMDIVNEDIHDYIGMMIDNEFDFVPMDTSLETFVNKIKEYHQLWSQGNNDKVRELMTERKKTFELKKVEIQKESEAINETLTKLTLETNEKKENKLSNVDEDGWTVVSSKKKNKSK